jgi:hypothetical protein
VEYGEVRRFFIEGRRAAIRCFIVVSWHGTAQRDETAHRNETALSRPDGAPARENGGGSMGLFENERKTALPDE